MALSADQLAAIKARSAAKTPGPVGWRGQIDGSVEFRTLHSGGLRIITTHTRPPCIDYHDGAYFLRDDEVLQDGPCDTCKKAYADGSFLSDRVHCERSDTWDTVYVWNPSGFCEPINKHAVREKPYRCDVASVTHPDAVFIEHAWQDVDDLLAEVERLNGAVQLLGRELQRDSMKIVDELKQRAASEPRLPIEDVERFLKRERDEYYKKTHRWCTIDGLLDAFRLHMVTGTPLTEPRPEGGPEAFGVGKPSLTEAEELRAEVERLRAELATAQQDAAKWGRVEFEIARRADHGDLDAQDLLATAAGEASDA